MIDMTNKKSFKSRKEILDSSSTTIETEVKKFFKIRGWFSGGNLF